jgi:hypothetical protein
MKRKDNIMKFNTRELVTIAVFGVLWGVVEISLGTVLKSLKVPMSGAVLAAIGLSIAMIGRLFVPRKGSTFFIGTIACILKLFSLGGVIIGPMVGIISEAIIAELVLTLGGKPRQAIFIIAGGLGVLWTFMQPFVTNPLLFGRSLWLNMLDQGSRLLGLGSDAVLLIVLAMIAIHLVLGGLTGLFAWNAGHQLQARMGRAAPEAPQF